MSESITGCHTNLQCSGRWKNDYFSWSFCQACSLGSAAWFLVLDSIPGRAKSNTNNLHIDDDRMCIFFCCVCFAGPPKSTLGLMVWRLRSPENPTTPFSYSSFLSPTISRSEVHWYHEAMNLFVSFHNQLGMSLPNLRSIWKRMLLRVLDLHITCLSKYLYKLHCCKLMMQVWSFEI